MLASELENTDQNAPLGTSAVDTVDGLRLGSVIAGVGGLIKVVGKRGGNKEAVADHSKNRTSETSGVGTAKNNDVPESFSNQFPGH